MVDPSTVTFLCLDFWILICRKLWEKGSLIKVSSVNGLYLCYGSRIRIIRYFHFTTGFAQNCVYLKLLQLERRMTIDCWTCWHFHFHPAPRNAMPTWASTVPRICFSHRQKCSLSLSRYPLVNQHNDGKPAFSIGKSTINVHFP